MRTPTHKILLVDDEYLLGEVLVQALREERIDAHFVDNVSAAIQRIESETFDLVVSDIYMPGQTGNDFFRFARANFPELPIIFMTGNPNVEMAVDLLKQGAYDYLAKPFLVTELVDKINQVMSKASKRRQEKDLMVDMKQILRQRLSELRIYQDVFESKNEGLLILDTEGLIVKVNPGFVQMSRLGESDLVNKSLDMLRGRLHPALDFSSICEVLREKGQWKRELTITRDDGSEWVGNISFFPVQDEEGKVFSYSAIVNDVTDFRSVEKALIQSLEQTNLAQEAIIFGLARLAEFRDQETGHHLARIRTYCRELSHAMSQHSRYADRIDEKFIDYLYRTAPLHDIGKVGIPDNILLKKGPLTAAEYEIMKTHTLIGYQTLKSIREQYGEMDFIRMGMDIAHAHHERFDGKGYPRGLSGADIPLPAQIVAVADVYDALTSERSYKKAFSHEVSVNTMKLERGKHFDPVVLDIFLSVADRVNAIRADFHKNGTPRQAAQIND